MMSTLFICVCVTSNKGSAVKNTWVYVMRNAVSTLKVLNF